MVYNYKIKVTLKGFEKQIKRTFVINDNVKINDFCKVIITSMNGYLEHLYTLKYKDKYYICDYMDKTDYNEIKMNSLRINKLLLEEKDKLELIYDFGDNWIFKISVAKVISGHNDKNIELIDGIGKGIEEDCGGAWGLIDLINDKNNRWNYDYDDFDIKKINDELDKKYNMRKQGKVDLLLQKMFENKSPSEISAMLINLNKFQLNRKMHIKKYNKLRKLHNEIIDSIENYIIDGKYNINDYYNSIYNDIDKEIPGLDFDLDSNVVDDRTILNDLFMYKNHPKLMSITEIYLQKNKNAK